MQNYKDLTINFKFYILHFTLIQFSYFHRLIANTFFLSPGRNHTLIAELSAAIGLAGLFCRQEHSGHKRLI